MQRNEKNKKGASGLKGQALLVFALVCSFALAMPVGANAAVKRIIDGYEVCVAGCSEPEAANSFRIFEVLDQEIKPFLLNNILPAINMASIAVVKTSAGIIETMSRLTQAQVDNSVRLAKARTETQFAVSKAVTIPGNNLMCHAVRVNQVEHLTRMYAEALGEFLAKNTYDFSFGADEGGVYKCIGPNAGHGASKENRVECNGSMGASDAKRARCYLGTWDPTDYPEEVKGFCEDSSVGSDPSKLDPAMRLADTRIDTIFDSLEFVGKKASPNPAQKTGDTTLAKKRLFLAAVNYCYNVYGFPPRRPTGVAARDSDKNEAAAFDLWEAQNSPVLHRCLQIVAEHTKPDCANAEGKVKTLCEFQKKICDNAKAHGVDVSAFVKETNNGECPSDQGLSYAEVKQIANEGCLTNQEYINIASTTTAGQAAIARAARACEDGVIKYRDEQRREREAFSKLVLGRNQIVGPLRAGKN